MKEFKNSPLCAVVLRTAPTSAVFSIVARSVKLFLHNLWASDQISSVLTKKYCRV